MCWSANSLKLRLKVEGVPALIHQIEVSWDATLDPASFFKIGQPDPMIEAMEAVFGNHDSLGEELAAEADNEWADVESLIKELEQFDGIKAVSKGRFFLSPGLAPAFQDEVSKCTPFFALSS